MSPTEHEDVALLIYIIIYLYNYVQENRHSGLETAERVLQGIYLLEVRVIVIVIRYVNRVRPRE